MKKGNIIVKLQDFFGATVPEMIFILVIIAGLLIGLVVQQFSPKKETLQYNASLNEVVYNALDSLAEANRAQYTGTDLKNNPDPNQTINDTKSKDGQTKEKKGTSVININTASKTELMQIPGVGDKTAIAIIEYRKSNPFRATADIKNIRGIGEKKYEKMKPFIEVK